MAFYFFILLSHMYYHLTRNRHILQRKWNRDMIYHYLQGKGIKRMILDIIILVIIAIAAVSGFHRGFVYTIVHLAGWAVSLVMAFLLTPVIKEFGHRKAGE